VLPATVSIPRRGKQAGLAVRATSPPARQALRRLAGRRSPPPAKPEEPMPKGYWIVRVSMHEPARYPEYVAAARPAFEKYGAHFVVRGGPYEAMEGTARERNVVVEFKDVATARACYNSPEYQAAKAIRVAIAEADFIIIEGA
jgi:uncharacterized protein (DUF1330 family)